MESAWLFIPYDRCMPNYSLEIVYEQFSSAYVLPSLSSD